VIGAGEIARRYARAVFGLAEGAKEHARLLEEVQSLNAEITGSAELTRVLLTPIHPRAERKKLRTGCSCCRLWPPRCKSSSTSRPAASPRASSPRIRSTRPHGSRSAPRSRAA